MLILAGAVHAQFSMSINIGSPPMWGPVGFSGVSYYYLPDVEAYYDVHSSMFIYFNGTAWIHRTSLPSRYRNYDLYGGYKVVMPDYHGNAPYIHFKDHKMKYGKGYRGPKQRTIGERPGSGGQGGHDAHGNNPGNHGNYENRGDDHVKGNNSGHGHDKGGGKEKRK